LKKVYTGNPPQEINYDSKYLARKLFSFFYLFSTWNQYFNFFSIFFCVRVKTEDKKERKQMRRSLLMYLKKGVYN
jgi:hypothetical protein